jgi:hypothetical protein
MKRKLSLVTLSACAALSGARASAQEPQQPEQHVIASPNPTVDDSKTTTIEPGKISGTKVHPATTQTAAPMKKKTSRKRRRTMRRRKEEGGRMK